MATPKTATTSFEAAFAKHADIVFQKSPSTKHIRPRKFNRLFGDQFQKLAGGPLTKIAFIRDPLEWIGSWYRYRSRDALEGHPNSTKAHSFNAFLEEYMKPENRKPFASIGSQGAFLRLEDGSVGVDKLFSYGRTQEALDFLNQSLGTSERLDFKNASPIMPLEVSPMVQTEFERVFANDIALYHSVTP